MNSENKIYVFSIGHSNHSRERFGALLQVADIQALIDVRTHPRSRFAHFNQGPLAGRLATQNIHYYFFGNELGGRPKTESAVDFEVIAKSPEYIGALNRVMEIAGKTRTALLCSEHEPLACHRCLLLGRSLAERGVAVRHILRDGRIELHEDTESRLLASTRRKTAGLPVPPAERLGLAYHIQAQSLLRKPK